MKKFLALLLAAMMLLSCTSALAATDTIKNGDSSAWANGANVDAEIDVFDTLNYADTDKFDTEGEMATELWMQVDATGQIDATVPLVLVFQTNIDGGDATSPETYKIVNNSTADLVVTKIESTKVANDADTQPMNIVKFDGATATSAMARDTYMARLNLGDAVINGKSQPDNYDLFKDSFEQDRARGGLFELARATYNKSGAKVGTDTEIELEMKTGPLSFVTSRVETGAKDQKMDLTKGIQLLTITYTIAIDTSDAIGEEIKGADGTELTAAGDIQDITVYGSGTVATKTAASANYLEVTEKTASGAKQSGHDDNN